MLSSNMFHDLFVSLLTIKIFSHWRKIHVPYFDLNFFTSYLNFLNVCEHVQFAFMHKAHCMQFMLISIIQLSQTKILL